MSEKKPLDHRSALAKSPGRMVWCSVGQEEGQAMSEIEIPAEGKEAWQFNSEFPPSSSIGKLADLAVYLLAGWMRSEFEREHRIIKAQNGLTGSVYRRCVACGESEQLQTADPRHKWTWEQWQDAARKRLQEAQ